MKKHQGMELEDSSDNEHIICENINSLEKAINEGDLKSIKR